MTQAKQLIHLGTHLDGVRFLKAVVAHGVMNVQLHPEDFKARFAGRDAVSSRTGGGDHLKLESEGITWTTFLERPTVAAVVTVTL